MGELYLRFSAIIVAYWWLFTRQFFLLCNERNSKVWVHGIPRKVRTPFLAHSRCGYICSRLLSAVLKVHIYCRIVVVEYIYARIYRWICTILFIFIGQIVISWVVLLFNSIDTVLVFQPNQVHFVRCFRSLLLNFHFTNIFNLICFRTSHSEVFLQGLESLWFLAVFSVFHILSMLMKACLRRTKTLIKSQNSLTSTHRQSITFLSKRSQLVYFLFH